MKKLYHSPLNICICIDIILIKARSKSGRKYYRFYSLKNGRNLKLWNFPAIFETSTTSNCSKIVCKFRVYPTLKFVTSV